MISRHYAVACAAAFALSLGCNGDPDSKNDDIGTVGQPDLAGTDTSSGPDTGGDVSSMPDATSGITEGELANCAAGDTCIVVPYSHCCGSTRRAINAANEAEYNAHPEWQVFNDEDVCAVIGACQDDSDLDAASCQNGMCALQPAESACSRMFGCMPQATDLVANVAATQGDCETAEDGGTLPSGLQACVDAATDCAAIAECVNCRTSFAGEFCRTVACPLAVDECILAADIGQCGIDCDNITGGAIGCFPGYEITCWEQAMEANDCSAASMCFRVY